MLNLVTTVTVEFSYFSNTNQYNTIYDLKRIENIRKRFVEKCGNIGPSIHEFQNVFQMYDNEGISKLCFSI